VFLCAPLQALAHCRVLQTEVQHLSEQLAAATLMASAASAPTPPPPSALALAVEHPEGASQSVNALRGLRELKVELLELRCRLVMMQTHFQIMVEGAHPVFQHKLLSFMGQLQSVQRLYREESAKRKQLSMALADARGTVRVFCRVRPPLPHELDAVDQVDVVELVNDTDMAVARPLRSGDAMTAAAGGAVAAGGGTDRKDDAVFSFDRAFGTRATQEDVYSEVEPLVESVLDGYNACVFAYGQTGSGKTFSMEGPAHARGVNYRAVSSLFAWSQVGTWTSFPVGGLDLSAKTIKPADHACVVCCCCCFASPNVSCLVLLDYCLTVAVAPRNADGGIPCPCPRRINSGCRFDLRAPADPSGPIAHPFCLCTAAVSISWGNACHLVICCIRQLGG
jgi:hypothetical protein